MKLVAGVDEVGRGPLAGPVVAAAVILPRPIPGLADSKQLSAKERERLARLVREDAIVALGAASVGEIERLNILGATMLAMRRAVNRLALPPEEVLVDGNRGPALACPVRCVVGGDASVPEISAASIVAKVARDRLMARLARRYEGYGWERNAGYGTAEHRAALERLGLTPHHRRAFAPCAQLALAV
ncbi:ribonuclease HII [Benzoatithermus flavus]|uniref:Ribonuclease HII n=1 Tax=Benzoatithermus flavus TaxID=3108223 RepID=A0ABU8XW84_9PROT